MKKTTLCAMLASAAVLAGCSGADMNGLLSSGMGLGKAASLSDDIFI